MSNITPNVRSQAAAILLFYSL